MPCLFLENVPEGIKWSPIKLKRFHETALKVLEGHRIEVHKRDVRYTLLTEDGEVSAEGHGVHGFIYWHVGRSLDQRKSLGDAIQAMLDAHGIGEGFDLTFIEGPKGRSFYVNRQMVE